ncbi:hypothetical protein Aduo_005059 [Ancylostoma duodenale]
MRTVGICHCASSEVVKGSLTMRQNILNSPRAEESDLGSEEVAWRSSVGSTLERVTCYDRTLTDDDVLKSNGSNYSFVKCGGILRSCNCRQRVKTSNSHSE